MEKVWIEARRRGFEVVVALDDRTSPQDMGRTRVLADQVIPWTSPGHCEPAYEYVQRCSEEFVLLISDDEEPSDLLWRLALEPPIRARFGVPVIPVVGKQMYRPDLGIQERLFYRPGWSWVGGFEGHSEGAKKFYLAKNPGVIVWHYLLDAPRSEREAKAARYSGLAPGDHRSRLIYEEHEDQLVPLPAHLLPFLR